MHAFGVSSNGRTRDFGSLYHGSNPCAPTNNLTRHCAGLIIGPWPQFAARNQRLPVRKQVGEISDSAVEPSRFPHSRRNAPCEGIECAPTKIKNTPSGYFFIWYSHGLCKSVSHLHRKTLLMFCNHFGKSQISQNGNGGTPPFPRVRPRVLISSKLLLSRHLGQCIQHHINCINGWFYSLLNRFIHVAGHQA